MNRRLSFFAIVSAFTILVSLLVGAGRSQAEAATLPDGWCNQPSNVPFQITSYGVDTIGHADGGIRAVYETYNHQIVLQRTVPREDVQVVETDVTLSSFNVIRYTVDCRYLIASINDLAGQYSIAVYDLLSGSSKRMGTIVNAGHNYDTVESSPDGNYLLVTAINGLYLWNLATNTQTYLSALVRSDCQISTVVGCDGHLSSYRAARWDVPHGLLQLDMVSDYTVTLNLPAATINRVEGTYSVITPDEAGTASAAFTSKYACLPYVQYQTYSHSIVLKDWLTYQVLDVLQDHFDLSRFQFLGWSATCAYAAAAMQDANGIRLVVWNVNDKTQQERPLTDWVKSYSWAISGDVISIKTNSDSFSWDVSGS